MANYFSQYQGGGPAALPPGYMQAATAPGRYLAEGLAKFADDIGTGIKERRAKQEERAMLEQMVEGEYGGQLENVDASGQPTPEAVEFLTKFGENVRDTSDMSVGQLKGLVQTMQNTRNQMQKDKEFALQERLVNLKEEKQVSDIALAGKADTRAEEKQVSDIVYKSGMLDVEKAKADLLQDTAYFKRFDALEKEKQEGESKAETQAGLREMFKGDTSDFGKQVSKALEGDFDPEIMRPWLDSKIKAEAARITKDELGKPELHDYDGQKVLTFGNTIVKLDNIDGKLQMQPDKLEQLRVRIKESISDIMAGFPYAAELERARKNPEASTPIQERIDALVEDDAELVRKYTPGAQTKSPTPPADTSKSETFNGDIKAERQKAEEAIKRGAPREKVAERFKAKTNTDL
ncbi:MAG: hypothetical protein CL524_11965 [Aequorivita sp.]|nr:hypothetical protein [Aequorivita sp.]